MRDQFAGDSTDWIKFSLLRTLAKNDRVIGIAWYYVGHVEAVAGEHLDEDVWLELRQMREKRSVRAIEELPIWPKQTRFFRKPVPPQEYRKVWLEEMKECLDGSTLTFLDPDNGIGNADNLHATMDEIRGIRASGRVVVLIHFPHRGGAYDEQVAEQHKRIQTATKAESIFTIRIRVTVQREISHGPKRIFSKPLWFTVIDADEAIRKRADEFVVRLKKAGCEALIEPKEQK
ncbi:MAG: hypothetical protein WB341_00510 [Terracidiphilus sp.]